MVNTPRDTSYLLTTTFGGGPGTIPPQGMRDFVVSGPQFDVASPPAGLAAPEILYGTVYGHKAPGLVMGTGIGNNTVRANNATVLQAAINYAADTGQFFELIPGDYEIYSSTGLYIPDHKTGFVWRGSKGGGDPVTPGSGSQSNTGYGGTQIIQYYNAGSGAPVMTIGVGGGGSYRDRLGFDIDGMHVRYGTFMTGLTNANTLVLKGMAYSRINNIAVQHGGTQWAADPTNKWGYSGYRGIYFDDANGNLFYSNTMRDVTIFGAQQNYVVSDNFSTGNVFENWYISSGGNVGGFVPCNDTIIDINSNGFGWGETVWEQLNMEWISAPIALAVRTGGGVRFRGLHFEGIDLTGANPQLMIFRDSSFYIESCNIVDLNCRVAATGVPGMTGTPVIFGYDPTHPCQGHVEGLSFVVNSNGLINIPNKIVMFYPAVGNSQDGVNVSQFSINTCGINPTVRDAMYVDPYMQTTSSSLQTPNSFSNYNYDIGGSCMKQPQLFADGASALNANYTHYGIHEDALIWVKEALSANITITLAGTMGPSGTEPPRVGNTVHIARRGFSSITNTCTIKDGPSNTTITTANSAFTYLHFRWNGTAWAQYTAISTSPYNE